MTKTLLQLHFIDYNLISYDMIRSNKTKKSKIFSVWIWDLEEAGLEVKEIKAILDFGTQKAFGCQKDFGSHRNCWS